MPKKPRRNRSEQTRIGRLYRLPSEALQLKQSGPAESHSCQDKPSHTQLSQTEADTIRACPQTMRFIRRVTEMVGLLSDNLHVEPDELLQQTPSTGASEYRFLRALTEKRGCELQETVSCLAAVPLSRIQGVTG